MLTTSPSDYLGLNSGETMKKTKAIMERAVGNVLVIDEVCGSRLILHISPNRIILTCLLCCVLGFRIER